MSLVAAAASCSERTYTVTHNAMAPAITNGQSIKASFKAFKNAAPARGDIVLYLSDTSPNELWLGRVVGVPGDTVACSEDALLVNGNKARVPGRFTYYLPQATNAADSKILPTQLTLGPSDYYVLADHTETGTDSRYFGWIVRSNIVAKVVHQ